MHFLFKPDISKYVSTNTLSPNSEKLCLRHIELWTNPAYKKIELAKMQSLNPEWDFMSRTYFVLSLANIGLRNKSYIEVSLKIIDTIIDNTLLIEKSKKFEHFLMKYGRHGGWKTQPPQSLFVDGEIALMLGARRLLKEKDQYRILLQKRVEKMMAQMRKSPILCAESYPDECWIFCNSVAIAAIKIHNELDKAGNEKFVAKWLKNIKNKLIDPKTGILISAFTLNGTPAPSGPGPEGTSIWMACKMLQIADPEFAESQYLKAKKVLGKSLFGFGYSREWPESSYGSMDIDSGPVIPVLGLSASASGLAIIAASSFNDTEYLVKLLTSLNFMGFPKETNGQLIYDASNPVGDSVLLYSLVQGPLWKKVRSLK